MRFVDEVCLRAALADLDVLEGTTGNLITLGFTHANLIALGFLHLPPTSTAAKLPVCPAAAVHVRY